MVTADHSHTSQIVGEDASGSGLPTGYSTNLTARDGQTLSPTHGAVVVPVWAAGPGSLGVLGTNDHTDLFQTLGG